MSPPRGLFLLLYQTLFLVASKTCNADDQCSQAPAHVQGSMLLQVVQLNDRLQKEGVAVNSALERLHSKAHAVQSQLSFTGICSSVESARRFFMKLIFGTPSLTHDHKVLLGVLSTIIGIAIIFALIWAGLIYFADRLRSATPSPEAGRSANLTPEAGRLPKAMDQAEWQDSVSAYRHVMTGKNSRTVIRGNTTPQAKESAILQSGIAQARVRDGTAGQNISPAQKAKAEAKDRDKRAQAAMARLSRSSNGDNGASASSGHEASTPEEAEWLTNMDSIDDGKVGSVSEDSAAFAPDHKGPKACKFFRGFGMGSYTAQS